MKPAYIQALTTAERAAAMKIGMASALARNRVPFAKLAQITNPLSPTSMAHGATGAMLNTAGVIAAISLIAGAPLGSAAHVIGRKIKGNRRDEQERMNRIKYYKDITGQLETGLAR